MSKFNSDRDEALHALSLDGTAEEIGDVGTWGHHYAGLGRVERSELGDRAGDFPDHAWVIVHEDGQGFVDVALYDSEAGYRADFDRAESQYVAFEDGAA
ncbi:hypothetical protein ACT17_06050 [Mycolicibacterium conceptionense]|uniref:Uncharacterized protein n=1 Tax=Mycolicibacterium conceptionense TaxID=451644 RepID=A0A0J8UE70_9MYCO|nr:hypothetical protein [Mycolicibacterium conceptionense]KMV19606.1 hypothetical protein ACT17_06050 [Mycolicibacterium conceptionense]